MINCLNAKLLLEGNFADMPGHADNNLLNLKKRPENTAPAKTAPQSRPDTAKVKRLKI